MGLKTWAGISWRSWINNCRDTHNEMVEAWNAIVDPIAQCEEDCRKLVGMDKTGA